MIAAKTDSDVLIIALSKHDVDFIANGKLVVSELPGLRFVILPGEDEQAIIDFFQADAEVKH